MVARFRGGTRRNGGAILEFAAWAHVLTAGAVRKSSEWGIDRRPNPAVPPLPPLPCPSYIPSPSQRTAVAFFPVIRPTSSRICHFSWTETCNLHDSTYSRKKCKCSRQHQTQVKPNDDDHSSLHECISRTT
jgi:hypothetical protein